MTRDIQALLGSCPVPIMDHKHVVLGHGSGGKLSHELIRKMVLPAFGNPLLDRLHDGATVAIDNARLAFSTDSYVVNPPFFPGGNIGDLAVNGTVNDVAMCGAEPLFLSVSLIIEEGLAMDELWAVLCTMRDRAAEAGVLLVTGDTKVVDRGKGDRIYINTAGIGRVRPGVDIGPDRARPGDVVLVSGPIAAHGMAVLSVREGLELESPILSDTAPLHGMVADMLDASGGIAVLRDATRGGIASALNEVAGAADVGIAIREQDIPIDADVHGACELLGFDPLYVANEGRLVALVRPEGAAAVLDAMCKHPLGSRASAIGEVTGEHPGMVVMKTRIGGNRVVDMLSGEQLPRIC